MNWLQYLRDLRVSVKIGALVFLITSLLLSGFGYLTYKNQEKSINRHTDELVRTGLQDIYNLLEMKYQDRYTLLESAYKTLYDQIENSPGLRIGEETSMEKVPIYGQGRHNRLTYWPVEGVDMDRLLAKAHKMTGADFMLLHLGPSGYYCQSTSFTGHNNQELSGYLFPKHFITLAQSTGDKAMQVHNTRLFGRHYQAILSPVPVSDGRAWLLTAVPMLDLPLLSRMFFEKTYFRSGFSFLVDSTGQFIIHPTEDIEDNKIDTEILFAHDQQRDKGKARRFLNKETGKYCRIYLKKHVKSGLYAGILIEESEMHAGLDRLKYTIILSVLIAILVLVSSIILILTPLTRKIRRVSYALSMLSSGRPAKKVESRNNDEIGQIGHSLNKLIDSFNDTSEFAARIGKGDYQAHYEAMSSEDKLGNSLLNMRESLKAASREEEKRKEEDRRRQWAAEGYAMFAEIMRQDNDDLNKLSYNAISRLVKYLEAVQGGIFLTEKDEDNKELLRLSASIAYDRQKYLEREFRIGEDLIGACAYEKESIYMNDVPDTYVNITSGLGGDKPRHLLISPLLLNDVVYGVIEIASFNAIESYQIEFTERIGQTIASTIATVRTSLQTQRLLKESQEQRNHMQQQEEEMRQNMEEMQATQEENERKESQMRSVLDAIDHTVGQYELNLDGSYSSVNEIFLKQINTEENEILGRKHQHITISNFEDPESYKKTWQSLLKGEHYKDQFKYHVHGKDIYLEESYTPVIEDGEVRKIIVLTNDITEIIEYEARVEKNLAELQEADEEMRQNLEELNAIQETLEEKDKLQKEEIDKLTAENEKKLAQLRKSEEQSRAILETSLDGVVIFNKAGIIDFFNASAEKLWGYKLTEIIGQHINSILDEANHSSITDLLNSTKSTGEKKASKEVLLIGKNEQKTEALMSIVATDVDGQERYTAFVHDLTEQKRAERERNALMEKALAKEFELNKRIEELEAKAEGREIDKAEQADENTLIPWTGKLIINVELIDKQHKTLVGLLNKLYQSFRQGQAKENLNDALDSLIDYTAYHFKTEEDYFDQFKYEHTEKHVEEHKKLVEQVVQFKQDFEAGKVAVSYDLLKFLKDWVNGHILKSDMQYAPLFREKLDGKADKATEEKTEEKQVAEKEEKPTEEKEAPVASEPKKKAMKEGPKQKAEDKQVGETKEEKAGTKEKEAPEIKSALSWQKGFELGIEEFDTQHKKLIEMMNGVFDAFKQGSSLAGLTDSVKQFCDYAAYHLSAEEEFMETIGYPDLAGHKQVHQTFFKLLDELQSTISKGNTRQAMTYLQEINQYYSHHITKHDKKYAEYFTDKKA